MRLAELYDLLHARTGVPKRTLKMVVNNLAAVNADLLICTGKAILPGFCQVKLIEKPMGRRFNVNKKVMVDAGTVIKAKFHLNENVYQKIKQLRADANP